MICTSCFQVASIKNRWNLIEGGTEDKWLPSGEAMPDTSLCIAVFTKDSFELTRYHTPKLEILWSESVWMCDKCWRGCGAFKCIGNAAVPPAAIRSTLRGCEGPKAKEERIWSLCLEPCSARVRCVRRQILQHCRQAASKARTMV